MPVISLNIIGQKDGSVFYPTPEQVKNVQNTIMNNELEVLSSNFPNQLGFVNHTDPKTGLNQYDIAKQAVYDSFPGYIVVAANQLSYPTSVYGLTLNDGISVLADIRIVELALAEPIQDAMTATLTAAIQSSLGADYPDLNINVASTLITGNVDISLPESKNVNDLPIDGVISAMARTSADGTDNVSFHDFLWSKILAATDAQGLNLHLINQYENIDGLRGGAGNDVIEGSNGYDPLLSGDDGIDFIIGGGYTDVGNNVISGDSGNDLLVAGGHKTSQFNQFLSTFPNAFNVQSETLNSIINSVTDNAPGRSYNVFSFDTNSGNDKVYNFHAATDQIRIYSGLNNSNITNFDNLLEHISISGDNLTIDFGADNSVTLVGVDIASLGASNVAIV